MIKAKNSLGKFVSKYSYVLVFVVIFCIYLLVCNGLTWNSTMNILRHSAVIGVIGIGMGLVCLTGEIDLSVGSMLALISGISVMVFNQTDSILATLIFGIVFGILCGIVNGVLVGVIHMPAFIVTLATMLIYRSIAQYICQHVDKALIGGGSSVYKMSPSHDSYQAFYGFGNGKIATIPVVGIILILIEIVFIYITTTTKLGKKIYAVGSNEKAAMMNGINVDMVKTVVFAITGALVGVASFLWIGMNASSDPATTGNSYEMYAIASVVLGGISMSGGRGKCGGIIFGAMSYTIIDKIIVALKMDSLINDSIKGIILILVILIQCITPSLKNNYRK